MRRKLYEWFTTKVASHVFQSLKFKQYIPFPSFPFDELLLFDDAESDSGDGIIFSVAVFGGLFVDVPVEVMILR